MADKTSARLVPRLRFPEFRNEPEWHERYLSELYTFGPTNSLSREKLNYDVGTVKNIHYGDIHTRFQSLFDITREVVPFVTPAAGRNEMGTENYCAEGDVIFADASEDVTDVGKCIEIVALNGQQVVSGMHTIFARRKDNAIMVGFGGHMFQSEYVRAQIRREAQGTKVFSISPGRLANIGLCVPQSTAEQQQIADCLSSLDDLIAAEGRKFEALRRYKQGLMQQLFPRAGETVPRLRFPEFENAGEWDAKLLSDICDLKAGEFVAASEIAEEPATDLYPCYGGNGLRGYVRSFTHDGRYVLVGRQGALCGNVVLLDGRFHATEHALVATPKIGIDTGWLFYALTGLDLNRFSIGQAQPGLSVGVLNIVPAASPTDEGEQIAIAECLLAVDSQIAREVQWLHHLRIHKKGLMQQLFPAPEAQ